MGNVKFILVLGLSSSSLSVGLDVRPSSADVRDLGEVCMVFFVDGLLRPPVAKAYGVLVYGERQQHIVLTNAGEPESGSAIVTGDKILVTLNSASASDDLSTAFSTTTHIILNASSLRGRFITMITWPASGPQPSKITGDVVPCQ